MKSREYLMESTILNFITLILDMQVLLKKPYISKWREPPYNFYVKKYSILLEEKKLWITWINLNGEQNLIRFMKPPKKGNIFSKLRSMFYRTIVTTDARRSYNVLTQVIFPDFCNELGIKADFSSANTPREAADLVMCFLYWNFFNTISVDKFIEMLHLREILSERSIDFIRNNKNFMSEGSVC